MSTKRPLEDSITLSQDSKKQRRHEKKGFTAHETVAVQDIRKRLNQLETASLTPPAAQTLFIAINMRPHIGDNTPQTWSYYLNKEAQEVESVTNPTVLQCYIGTDMSSVCTSCLFESDKTVIMKLPVDFFGTTTRMMYKPNKQGLDLDQIFRSLQFDARQQPTEIQTVATRKLVEIKATHRNLQRYWDRIDGQDESRSISEYLWDMRHSCNSPISAAIMHYRGPACEVLIPYQSATRLIARGIGPGLILSRDIYELLNRCTHFWGDATIGDPVDLSHKDIYVF